MITLDEAQASPLATISVKDAAYLAGVDRRTLAAQLSVHGGEIASRAIGRRIVIPRKAFLDWLLNEPHRDPIEETVSAAPSADPNAAIRAKLIELLSALESTV